MREFLRKKIRQKLGEYRQPLNRVDESLPLTLPHRKTVAVVGAGLAGISAASHLAERGFAVTLWEKENHLGGKMGAWTFESKGETLRMEHGFHAFFRQYHNLREYLKRIGAYENLRPVDDYVILFEKNKRQGFKNLDPTPGLNVLDLRKHGVFGIGTLLNPLGIPFLQLLRYNREKTFRRFDTENFARYARRTRMPARMRLVFNSFARAFFSEPEKMSMAELIKGFHFYFLGNEDGLLYDVLDDDFSLSFLAPAEQYLRQHGVDIRTGAPVTEIGRMGNEYRVNGKSFDYLVLCTDVKHLTLLLERSPVLQQYSGFNRSVGALKASGRYAVYRVWTDRFESGNDPFFLFTDRLQVLDSITFYHRMEKTSERWSNEHRGGIFELHCYAVPDSVVDDEAIKKALLAELFHYFPELEGMNIVHEHFRVADDFPAFHTGQYASRPGIETEIPGVYLAGDWVKQDNCSMLMEAAFTAGAQAANLILEKEGLRTNALFSGPQKGVLA